MRVLTWVLFSILLGTIGLISAIPFRQEVTAGDIKSVRLQAEADALRLTKPEKKEVALLRPDFGELPTERKFVGPEGRDKYDYPNRTPDYIALQALFYGKHFERLSAQLEAFEDDIATDFRNELWSEHIYLPIADGPPEDEALFDEWISAQPNSFAPYLAKAFFYKKIGWIHRGHEYARETADGQMRTFEQYMEKAQALAHKALALRPHAFSAYRALIRLANVRPDGVGEEAWLDQALTHYPDSFLLRQVYADGIRSIWGGAPGEHTRYAQSLRSLETTNPRMKLMRALPALEAARLHNIKDEYGQAWEQAEAALEIDPDNLDAMAMLLSVHDGDARRNAQHEKLLARSDALLAKHPQSISALNHRVFRLQKLERTSEAKRELAQLLRVGWGDPRSMKKVRRQIETSIMLARIARDAGQLETAMARVEDALLLKLDYPPAICWKKLHEQMGIPRDRNYLNALDWQCTYPNDMKYITLLNEPLTSISQHESVLQHWDRFIAQNPTTAKAYLMRGTTHASLKATDLAQADFSRACELGEQSACGR
jgi:hypothetical protein